MSVIFNTATTVNGYLADTQDRLDWLFEVPDAHPDDEFMSTVGVLVMGSTTYEWVLNHESLLEHPEKWHAFFGDRPTFVFTTRELDAPAGADVRFVRGEVADQLPAISEAAAGRHIWVQGGGDLAGQFLDAGALDEIVLSVAPVFLPEGRALLPRDVRSDRLSLTSVEQQGQFGVLRYAVTR